jgi:hypothetical protein
VRHEVVWADAIIPAKGQLLLTVKGLCESRAAYIALTSTINRLRFASTKFQDRTSTLLCQEPHFTDAERLPSFDGKHSWLTIVTCDRPCFFGRWTDNNYVLSRHNI